MAMGAVLATALTDHGSRAFTLTVGGVDVILQPRAASGSKYGAPIDQISVIEAGPGGVSSMAFVIEAPAGGITLDRGLSVTFWNVTQDYPIFRGFVDRWSITPWGPGATRINVSATGIETLLDWIKVEAVAVPAGIFNSTALQLLLAQTINGIPGGELRALDDSSGLSSQAFPLANTGLTPPAGYTIAYGTTLREAARQLCAQAIGGGLSDGTATAYVTIDFYAGLRLWAMSNTTAYGVPAGPSDYAPFPPFVVTDAAGSANVAAELEDTTDAGGMPVAVVVIGAGGVAGFAGGTDTGDCAVITDTSVTTAAEAQAAALSTLSRYAPMRRGKFRLEGRSGNLASQRAGCVVDLTDADAGVLGSFMVGQIEKVWHGATEDWTITYGGLAPSMTTLARRLTRNTPN